MNISSNVINVDLRSAMKKIISIVLLLCTILCFGGCKEIVQPEKKVVKYIQNLKNYTCDVEYTFKNEKDQDKYSAKHYYMKDEGYRLDLGEDRVNIYKGDYIYVEDKKAGKKYEVIKEFDEIYKYTFLNEIVDLTSHPESKVYAEDDEESDKHYVVIEFIIPSTNRNIAKGVLYMNSLTLKPEVEKIYDLKGEERVEIRFNDFVANEAMEKEAFQE
ncbi:hypothetical protein KQH81_02935 [Clostridium cadaveris]|uniref:germination lipoprotein GerS-related protein n=1 Tax=Clostridium cadaveris TaxID=1529 RepID=UPI001E5309A8|nr:germination lipoprotein GerS-related protein [Clostridium cadaveris]UFH65517.1 hypothetical protein KQH81_02935 [Clostridium cadaveris]